jgi:hypothetical protein
MRDFLMASLALLVATALSGAAAAQTTVGDKDDQIVITGCVMASGQHHTQGPRSMLVWSKGNVYLDAAATDIKPADTIDRPVGTGGPHASVFYWIEDENDFAKYVGRRVEIVGELSDRLKKGEVEVRNKGQFTELEFDAGGREAKARVPSDWLGPQTPGKNAEFDVMVRTVDVEKVTVVGACAR